MDTNRIKRFATEARNKLKEGIAAKIRTLGFDKKGNVAEEHRPQLMQGGTHWNGQLLPETFYHQWTSLYHRIQLKGISEVYEEAAYTWFNRLCAIRILQKNDLCAPVLDYTDAARTPFIVDEARQGRLPEMNDEMRSRLSDLLDDDTKVTEQFAVLINAWCHDNPIIHRCFGAMADYTELLLPNNILTEGGFVDMLNHTDFITDADYRSPELIGWLYQFYISERKDEVFAKKGKFEADEIPAATQIFTPNWIVKYMVQNTVGRIYLDNNPYETQLQKKWKYLVEPFEKPSADSILKYEELTDFRVADLACGSGHILNECFDLLYDLYIAEGYGRGEAIENIFRHNLTGVDLDTRAKQLATFALLLKACQKDNAFADAHCLPNVLDMTGIVPDMNEQELSDACLRFIGGYENVAGEMLEQDFELLRDADNLGSIMKFNDDEDYLAMLRYHYEDWTEGGIDDCPEEIKALIPGVRLILALSEKYHALVMNPPYMGGGNMNATLSKYVKCNYEEGKADMMTVFMVVAENHIEKNGKIGMITLPSWLFLSTFENLRKNIVVNYHIDSLLHMGRGIFGIDWGSTAFVVSNCINHAGGMYFRLHKRNFQHIYYYHIEQLFLKALNNHDFKYDFDSYRDDDVVSKDIIFESSETGLQLYYPNVSQRDFEKIPGCPIGYWVSDKVKDVFTSNLALSEVCKPVNGLTTSDNARFLRFWFEVSQSRIGVSCENAAVAARSQKKWFYYNKGGATRKWFGNHDLVINWENDGIEIKGIKGPVLRNPDYYFKKSISWSLTSSIGCAFRYNPDAALFDVNGMSLFPFNENDFSIIIGALNTKIYRKIASLINPTLALQCGDVMRFPFPKVMSEDKISSISNLANENISISKQDWDAHETSWDFERNPLYEQFLECMEDDLQNVIPSGTSLEELSKYAVAEAMHPLTTCMHNYKDKWEMNFMRLHKNEEELNRQFIDIYGLQDELTPDVPLDEITILQQGEISIENDRIKWHDDVVMKQFISYAVGCMMGRYRLDKKGLHIAHPNPTAEETAPYIYNKVKFEIDEDGIIPLMPNDSGFSDNASNRFADFVRIALGDAKHVENLNFVEKCLGKSVEQYFVKDFWKDHKKMYQNRPIYWLFASKKGAFQCIAYMHRMNAYTAERIRAKYLLPYIETLQARITDLDARRSELTTRETKQFQQLTKTLEECQEYHDRLQVVAEQAIAFELDDGVVVNYAKFGDVVQKIK
ncbi:MAG: BREX-1 system adenine-specific DNA-methyltransferase PglX [Prevotella sp.]|nr:BREX-1 system adenine-specific DNA-methyltransferase PglX [Prevotella sp.]